MAAVPDQHPPHRIPDGLSTEEWAVRSRGLSSRSGSAQCADYTPAWASINPKQGRRPSPPTAFALCIVRLAQAFRVTWRNGRHSTPALGYCPRTELHD